LHPIPAIDLNLAAIVDPRDAEHHHAVGHDDPLIDLRLDELGMLGHGGLQGRHDFFDGLMELRLAGVLLLHHGDDILNNGHFTSPSVSFWSPNRRRRVLGTPPFST
jgi:hypothetical protein